MHFLLFYIWTEYVSNHLPPVNTASCNCALTPPGTELRGHWCGWSCVSSLPPPPRVISAISNPSLRLMLHVVNMQSISAHMPLHLYLLLKSDYGCKGIKGKRIMSQTVAKLYRCQISTWLRSDQLLMCSACMYNLHLFVFFLHSEILRHRLHVYTRSKRGPILAFTLVFLDTGYLSDVPKKQFNGAEWWVCF